MNIMYLLKTKILKKYLTLLKFYFSRIRFLPLLL